jgi:hypothetical protein
VKLIPFSADYLRLREPLPFGLYDGLGRLLLASGQIVGTERRLSELSGLPLFSDEAESAEWNRRLAVAIETAIRQGAPLKDVAAARPDPVAREAAVSPTLTVPEQWRELVDQLNAVLRDVRPDGDWRARLLSIHGRARMLFSRRPDASLYCMVFEAGSTGLKYSSSHALLSLVVAEAAAGTLGWSADWIDSLGRAALTMNAAMTRLQDQLALTRVKPTPEERAEIDAHAAGGAALLQAAGLSDRLCLEVVRLHHDASLAEQPLSSLPAERQLARLLRRVDIFAAKISCRASRKPMSPLQAAREACLGAAGVPDEIGAALLKAVGLYPPGSFVKLATGELGIVLARGGRADQPRVASLVSASGDVLGEPVLRDTSDRRFAVAGAVAAALVRVRPSHDRLLAMI